MTRFLIFFICFLKEWKEDLRSLVDAISDPGKTERRMLQMARSKIRALYGDDEPGNDYDTLLRKQNFSEILASEKKKLSCDNVSYFSILFYIFVSINRAADI